MIAEERLKGITYQAFITEKNEMVASLIVSQKRLWSPCAKSASEPRPLELVEDGGNHSV